MDASTLNQRAFQKIGLFAVASLVLSALSCNPPNRDSQTRQDNDSDLRITFGGFREGHPDEGKLGGVCSPDLTRNILDCDIYNGLEGWTVTEVTVLITWAPPNEDNKRNFVERVSIAPLTSERVSIRLGLQLPDDTQLIVRGRPLGKPVSHWGWQIVSAKGHRTK